MNVFDEIRRDYQTRGLEIHELGTDPFEAFDTWFVRAVETSPGLWAEPNAMALSTAVGQRVSSRVVLLKDYNHTGLTFFTNYDSDKGRQLAANPNASLLFYWGWLARQVRIEGAVTQTDRQTADAYFHSRPRGAQLSALASKQSSVIASREEFVNRRRELELRYDGVEVPLPETWGGYRLTPVRWEFWQGREDRSHDRFRYLKNEAGEWEIHRLAP